MEKRFDAIVLIPLSLVVGMAGGIMVMGGELPMEMMSKAVTILLATYVALVVIELLIRVVSDSVIDVLYAPEEPEPETGGAPGELTILLLRDGDIVGEMKSWDKPLDRGKRGYWIKKLGRLFARRKVRPAPAPDLDKELF